MQVRPLGWEDPLEKEMSQEVDMPQPAQGLNFPEATVLQPACGFDLHEAVTSLPAWGSAPCPGAIFG